MNNWNEVIRLYFSPKIIGIFLLGFSSGLPFLLILATLSVWLTESGIDKETIGIFTLVTVPYALKFIIAPIISKIPIPIICRLLGHNRGWLVSSQLMIIIFLIILGNTNPAQNIYLTALSAFFVGVFSAVQDILVESYRIDILSNKEMGIGASASNLGYRFGMWVSGAIALYLAHYFSWFMMYNFMALCMIVGIITALLIRNKHYQCNIKISNKKFKIHMYFSGLKTIILSTIKNLSKIEDFFIVLAYIALFKLADAGLNVMANPFLIEIGFSKIQIAYIGKSFGIGAMIIGGVLSGILLLRYKIQQVLLLCSVLQSLSAIAFFIQNYYGNDISVLFFTVFFENLSNGMGYAAFISYVSIICKGENSSTKFALLSSFASLSRVIFSYAFGYLADNITWANYYISLFFLCLLCCVLLLRYYTRFSLVCSINGISRIKADKIS